MKPRQRFSGQSRAGRSSRRFSPATEARTASDWRYWLPLALIRALAAAGFSAMASFESRFGDATLVATCLLLAGIYCLVAVADWYTRRRPVRPEIVADVVSLIVLVPAVAVAGNTQVADGRFGGRLPNVLAAIGAVMLILVIIALIAHIELKSMAVSWSIGTLPAALTIAAIIGGAGYFATQQLSNGLAFAWLSAAVATILVGLLPRNRGTYVAAPVYILFAVGVLIVSRDVGGTPNINTSATGLSYLAMLIAGIIIFLQSMQVSSVRS